MRAVACLLAYDGGQYLGWQDNRNGSSVEATLRAVLEQILQHPVSLSAASRTDVGVHAEGQVVTFSTERTCSLTVLAHSANQLLPEDIVIREMWLTDPSFHPTTQAKGKEYHYLIDTGRTQLPLRRHFAWHVPYELQLPAMRRAAEILVGTHDFRAFCNQRKQLNYASFVRTVERIEVLEPAQEQLVVAIRGTQFLYKMVRNIVGTLVYVGRGRIEVSAVEDILRQRDRKQAGMTAPGHGLVLKRVFY